MGNPALLALLAYGWWGLVPLYWKQLAAFPAEELILYRVLLSCLFLAPFLGPRKARAEFLAFFRSRRLALGLLGSGLLIGFNWYLYVWAVNNGHVVDASLGYFLNPLVNVALGTLLLKEQMSRPQKVACAFAAAGAFLLAASTGVFPWIAILLALSFALYGLARKILHVPTIPGTLFETLLLALPASLALLWFYRAGLGHGPAASAPELWILAFGGAVTTIPLLAFAEAAKGLPLSVLGFFQFLSPTLQFLLGVFVYREPFGIYQWLSFSLIWTGLGIFALGRFLSRPLQR